MSNFESQQIGKRYVAVNNRKEQQIAILLGYTTRWAKTTQIIENVDMTVNELQRLYDLSKNLIIVQDSKFTTAGLREILEMNNPIYVGRKFLFLRCHFDMRKF